MQYIGTAPFSGFLFLKISRAASVSFLESFGKIAVVIKAAKSADSVYRVRSILYHISRIAQTVIFQIFKRGLSRYVFKAPQHFAFADECGRRHIFKGDLFRIMLMDKQQYITKPCFLRIACRGVRCHILFRKLDKYPKKLGKLISDNKLMIRNFDVFRTPYICEQSHDF